MEYVELIARNLMICFSISQATIMIFTEGEEPLSFWQTLSDESPETMTEECIPMKASEMHVPENFQPIIPRWADIKDLFRQTASN